MLTDNLNNLLRNFTMLETNMARPRPDLARAPKRTLPELAPGSPRPRRTPTPVDAPPRPEPPMPRSQRRPRPDPRAISPSSGLGRAPLPVRRSRAGGAARRAPRAAARGVARARRDLLRRRGDGLPARPARRAARGDLRGGGRREGGRVRAHRLGQEHAAHVPLPPRRAARRPREHRWRRPRRPPAGHAAQPRRHHPAGPDLLHRHAPLQPRPALRVLRRAAPRGPISRRSP